MSESTERNQSLLTLQEIDFGLLELNLYLDTHLQDPVAVNQYNYLIKLRKKWKKQVEAESGPLTTNYLQDPSKEWEWSMLPWPWQID